MATPVRTTCPYCGVGCGVIATDHGSHVEIDGDPEHPANFGRLCSKGSALAETLIPDGRLLHPMIGGERTSWNRALDHVADRFADVIAEHGPDAVAFYVSGQLLTEDYYVVNKLAKGFLGTANIDTNSRLCMASAVAAHKRAFGTDTVPCSYTDLEEADLVIITGSNLAWCHPVLFQRLMEARERRPSMRIIVIDPRRTATAEGADLHLQLRSGSDGWLFNHLLAFSADAGLVDPGALARVEGFEAALERARASAPDLLPATGLDPASVRRLERLVLAAPRILTLFSMGINQSSSGTDKANAIINFHLATGQIGRPGCGPFSITGQPNAMGGREVGGLANQLAAHVDFDDPERAARIESFWRAERMATRPGLKAVDLFEAVLEGRVKALWVMATNPAVSMPDNERVKKALAVCPFLVVSDCIVSTDTARYADVLLPAAGWGEKDGTVTNSERRISRQRAIRPISALARPDWQIVTQVARRLGFANAFSYESPAEIFAEHARLTDLVRKDLDLASLAHADYDRLEPFQWHGTRPFADGRFYTRDGKARMVAVQPRAPALQPRRDELRLNTGRYRDHWHTMSRTGLAPTLWRHRAEPLLELHADDAGEFEDGDLVAVERGDHRAILRLRISDALAPGTSFAPMHRNDQFAGRAAVNALIAPHVDPLSGQPEFKSAPVRVRSCNLAWRAFVASRRSVDWRRFDYWSVSRIAHGFLVELGHETDGRAGLLDAIGFADDESWAVFEDPSRGVLRAARIEGSRLETALCIGELPAREWLSRLIGVEVSPHLRANLLAGSDPGRDRGPVVCACFAVHQTDIVHAAQEGARSVAEIGASLRAGTNCGSCKPEIRALLAPLSAARVAAE